MAKKKETKVKDLFKYKQMTIQDLIEEIKFEEVQKGSKEEIKDKKDNLKSLIERQIVPFKKKLKEIEKSLNKEKNHFERLKLANEYRRIENKLKQPDLNIDWQKNEIRKLEGKDFYYIVNTPFDTHKIYRSVLMKEEGNEIFLNLMKNDVLATIEKLKDSDEPDAKNKIEILKQKLLPVIEFNLQIDKVRDADINKLSKKMKKEIETAADTEINKEDKKGKYPIDVIISGELIELL